MRKKTKLVCGVGVNDVDYKVTEHAIINGKEKIIWRCPFYSRWREMLRRYYEDKLKERAPTYNLCSTIPEWLYLSNFKAWMETQDWEGKHLDKDLLVPGNKLYSPDTCIFIDQKVNKFLTDSSAARGETPIGVSFNKRVGKFAVKCGTGSWRKNKNLGYFETPEEAHEAWLRFKLQQAHILANEQDDQRVAKALISRYENCLD